MGNNLQLAHSMPPGLSLGNLESYVAHVNNVPMLTAEEEHKLATQWHEEGDLLAAQRLVLSHLRFVVKVARGYSGYGLSQADLIQEGNIGLMKAVKRFDPGVGVRLVTFAVHWIKAEIHEFVLKNWRIVKVATTKAQRKLFFNLRKAKKRLGWFSQDEIKDVANELGVKPETVVEMEARMNAHDASLDHNPYDDSDSEHFNPTVAGYLEDHSADPAKLIEHQDAFASGTSSLHDAFTQLDDRSQDIIQQRWLAEKKTTLQDLSTKYSVSLERIRQIEKQALGKLKDLMQ